MKTKEEWAEAFNALPFEIRTIAVAVSLEDQINVLRREKRRLKKRYKQSVKEINAHIKNLKHILVHYEDD